MRTTFIGLVALAASALGIALAAPASAVPVTGRLAIPRNYRPPPQSEEGGPASYYWQERNGVIDARPPRLDVPREIAAVLLGAADRRPDSSFLIQGGMLMPSTLVVQAGSELRIQNTDGCAHELYADGIEHFEPIQTAPGLARTMPLPATASSFVIRDRIYPHVRAHVHVVTDLVARGTVGRDGRIAFDDVPEGTYTLKVFYGDHEIGSQEIEVVAGRQFAIDGAVPLNLPASQ